MCTPVWHCWLCECTTYSVPTPIALTGHTLRLLTLPDFLDTTVGKVVRLRQKILDAANAVKGVFGVKSEKDPAVEKLELLKVVDYVGCSIVWVWDVCVSVCVVVYVCWGSATCANMLR